MAIKRSGPGFATLNAALKGLNGVEAKTGWFKSAVYPSGVPVAYVAAIMEFGSGAIPPRPTMRPTVAAQTNAWMALLAQGATAALAGRVTPMNVLGQVAAKAAGDVGLTITNLHYPTLSPITLILRKWRKEGRTITGATVGEAARELRKGPVDLSGVSTKPLIDTGYLFQQLTFTVEKVR